MLIEWFTRNFEVMKWMFCWSCWTLKASKLSKFKASKFRRNFRTLKPNWLWRKVASKASNSVPGPIKIVNSALPVSIIGIILILWKALKQILIVVALKRPSPHLSHATTTFICDCKFPHRSRWKMIVINNSSLIEQSNCKSFAQILPIKFSW